MMVEDDVTWLGSFSIGTVQVCLLRNFCNLVAFTLCFMDTKIHTGILCALKTQSG